MTTSGAPQSGARRFPPRQTRVTMSNRAEQAVRAWAGVDVAGNGMEMR